MVKFAPYHCFAVRLGESVSRKEDIVNGKEEEGVNILKGLSKKGHI